MATDQERIDELERENKELRSKLPADGGGEGGEPLTLAEIRAMSREEVEQNWDRVKRSIAQDPPGGAAGEDGQVHGPSRMSRAYSTAAEDFRAGYEKGGEGS